MSKTASPLQDLASRIAAGALLGALGGIASWLLDYHPLLSDSRVIESETSVGDRVITIDRVKDAR